MNYAALAQILALYPNKDQRRQALEQKNRYKETPVFNALLDPQSLTIILDLYAEDFLKLLLETYVDGQTLLHQAISYPESLTLLLYRLDVVRRYGQLVRQDKHGKTLLQHAAHHPQSLKIMLDSLRPSDLVEAISTTDWLGKTLLQYATAVPQSLAIILQRLPDDATRVKLLKQNTQYGDNIRLANEI